MRMRLPFLIAGLLLSQGLLAAPEPKAAVKDEKAVKEAAKPAPALPKVVVDVEGLASRLFPFPVKPGNYFIGGKPLAADEDLDPHVLVLRTPQRSAGAAWA